MIIKKYRYFFSFLDSQQKWLNDMASKGYRLINIKKLLYEFETCNPDEYEYCVEFVADKSYKQICEYRDFLESIGYKTFTKNINLNYSFGKVRLRLFSRGGGKIATSPGGFNKELLILEKKRDGKPFNIHSSYDDLIKYYTPIRNMYLQTLILDLILIFYWKWISLIIALILIVPIFKYSAIIKNYKELGRTNE